MIRGLGKLKLRRKIDEMWLIKIVKENEEQGGPNKNVYKTVTGKTVMRVQVA